MADQNRGEIQLSLVLGDHAQNGVFPNGILPGGRLVEQNDPRIRDQGARQRRPFLHAPGKFRRIFISRFRQLRLLHTDQNLAMDLRLFQARRLDERQRDIVVNRHRIEQGVALKHITDLTERPCKIRPAHFGHRLAPKQDHAFIRLQKSDDVFEQHAFAGTGKTDNRRDLPFVDLEIDAVQDDFIAETFGHVFKFNQRRLHLYLFKSAGTLRRNPKSKSGHRKSPPPMWWPAPPPGRRGCPGACARNTPDSSKPSRQSLQTRST